VAELAAHARHDRLLVAQSVDRGARRSPMLELCARCAALYADLVALTTAIPLSAVPSRPRDFRLSASDAHRLERGGWRRWWAIVGAVRESLTRPIAIGFTTLGLAGLLLSAGQTLLPSVGAAFGAGSTAPATQGRNAASAEPTDVPFIALGGEPKAYPPEVSVTVVVDDPVSTAALSAGLLGVGVGLFAIRHIADRRDRVR
jgi:hypothetical protein